MSDNLKFVFTLVAADPDRHPVTVAMIDEIIGLLAADKIASGPYIKWLRDDVAAEIEIGTMLSQDQMAKLRQTLADRQIDIFCQAAEGRRKQLLLADMDSTIVTGETLDDLADLAGIGDKIAAITKRAMNGELDFIEAIRERVAMLKDLPADLIQTMQDDLKLNEGARNLVNTMRNHGATCVLVSGGFTVFTEPVALQAGFHHHHGNTLGVDGDRFTGVVHDPILDRDTKLRLLREYAQDLDLSCEQAMAIGDGANDLAMLDAAGLGIGYHPKDLLQKALPNHIIHGDLSTALYAQGFSYNEFAIK